jgi:general secretion pathway protein J
MMGTKQRLRLAGFSLIEVMVATLLMGMMGVLLMTSLRSSADAKDNIEATSGRYQLVRQAMSRMAREISMAFLSRDINKNEAVVITQFKGSKEQLFFSAFGNVIMQKDAAQSDQQVLGYFIAKDKTGKQSLMRSHVANLNLDVEKGGKPQVLVPDVIKIEFSYYDEKFDRWEEKWISDPSDIAKQDPASIMNEGVRRGDEPKLWKLPAFVKVSLTVKMAENDEMTWVTQTKIPMQQPLNLE